MSKSKSQIIADFSRQAGDLELEFDRLVDGFITTLLWSEREISDDGSEGESFEGYDVSDIVKAGIVEIYSECLEFFKEANGIVFDMIEHGTSGFRGEPWSQVGHDFCLTRNGHGAGFWDGHWGEAGRALTDLSKPYGTIGLYKHLGKLYTHN